VAQLSLVSKEICRNIMAEKEMGDIFEQEFMVCAGGSDTDTCLVSTNLEDFLKNKFKSIFFINQGDSGGPLTVQTESGKRCLYGVTSWGPSGCAVEGFPGVYTR